jgi:hypothetical protein
MMLLKVDAFAQENIYKAISEENIDDRELQREMLRYRAQIVSDFTQKYQLNNLQNFWENIYQGRSPKKALEELALTNLLKIKIQEQWLKAEGLWPYKNYDEFLNAMAEENKERDKLQNEGQVIYGPVLFQEQTYFDYKFSNAIIKLKQKYEGTKISLNDSVLNHHFKDLKQSIYKNSNKSFQELKSPIKSSFIEKVYAEILTQEIIKYKPINKN